MGSNKKRDWALDNEEPTELDNAVNFLNGRKHLTKTGEIDRYAVGRIMIEWASQKDSTSDEALPIANVVGQSEQFNCGDYRVWGREKCKVQCNECKEGYGDN